MRVIRALSYAACLTTLSGILACSSVDTPLAAGTASSVGTVKRLEVRIEGSTVTPPPAQIELGIRQILELVITSDHDDELHAHGFEAEAALKAGVPTTVRLTFKEAGVYELETHEPALTLLTIAVR